jgi:surface protein
MSETKINFSYKDQKIELNFTKNELLKDILTTFTSKLDKNKSIEDFNFLYSGQKISINTTQKLSDLNDKDDLINISVYPRNEANEINPKAASIVIPANLKFKESKHIICPRCKGMSEIDINDFKITIKNCNSNHSMSGLFMNDFVNTQYVDESRIKCKFCKKTEYELINDENNKDNILLLCSCGVIYCQKCKESHDKNEIKDKNIKHSFIEYKNKDYFCIEHNLEYFGYCHKCKKNICEKCEKEKHDNHKIDYYKKVSPTESFIQKIEELNKNLISKVTKFNQELKELIELINNISHNIQNDLKIFLKISSNVIENFNLNRKNYQTIQNIKNIYNTINNTPIFTKIDSFLNNTNSSNRLGYIIDMYNKMYLETSCTNNITEESTQNINANSNKEVLNNNASSETSMTVKYTPNLKKIKDNKMKIFGKKFVENNKDKCILIINGKENPLTEFYTLKKNDLKNNELEIKLKLTKKITDMSYMFYADSTEPSVYLTSISNLVNWDTSSVTDMSNFLGNCILLTSIPDISKWDTKNINNISNLFYHCTSLTSLPDISKWSISNVTNLSYMFYDCKLITKLPDISLWDTSKVIDMRGIFSNCSSLTTLPDISKWNTNNVNNMSGLFHHCSKLAALPDISVWNTGNVVNMGGMFDHCVTLKTLPDLSKWDTKKVTNLNYIFYFCSALSKLPDISQWNTDNVTNMKGMFCDCTSLSIIPDISKWNTAKVTNMSCMFYNCSSLLSLPDLLEWDISKVVDLKNMFYKCDKLPEQVVPRKFKL